MAGQMQGLGGGVGGLLTSPLRPPPPPPTERKDPRAGGRVTQKWERGGVRRLML